MKVACINRNNLKDIYQQNKLIFKTSFDAIIDDFSKIEFLEKTKIETNDNFKQIIPYTIILNQNNQIAFYRRKGNLIVLI
jgi:predicted NUDIX family phosphoesterase